MEFPELTTKENVHNLLTSNGFIQEGDWSIMSRASIYYKLLLKPTKLESLLVPDGYKVCYDAYYMVEVAESRLEQSNLPDS